MAARFRFALQPLLDRRTRVEREKRHRLMLLRREWQDAVRDGERLAAAFGERAVRTSDAGSLALFDDAIAARRLRTARAQSALQAARRDMIAARRDRRVIERLREVRARAFEEEEARREERELQEANARCLRP